MQKSETETKFKSVSGSQQGNVRFVKAKALADEGVTGVVAEGTYEGRVEEQTKFGLKNNVKIRALNGDLIIVNEAGNLDYRMNQAEKQGLAIGGAIQISYLGKTPMASGDFKGTLSHSFDVAIETLDEAA